MPSRLSRRRSQERNSWRWRAMPKRKYRSEALRSAHVTVEGLHRIGLVDKKTMREFDHSCLTSIEDLSPRDIAAIRKRAGVSQGVFARHLNVPTSLVSQWERGEGHPTGAGVKLFSIVMCKGVVAVGWTIFISA